MIKKRKRPRSAILAAVHETMVDLHEAGILGATGMRKFDALCRQTGKRPRTGPLRSGVTTGTGDVGQA